ncbi:MAG TPA: amidase [Mycobacteriales bacterium]|nr:amidase [Mycobacteriales bacterium]
MTATLPTVRVRDPLAFLPALEQADLIRRGELTPAELVEIYLERTAALDPDLGAYVTVDADRVRAAAAAAASHPATDTAPLRGVTLSVKDLTRTAGLRTTLGIAGLRDDLPERDDHVVTALHRAGLLLLGKTTTPALGLGCVSEPAGLPAARNPWDRTRSAGGSSGGAAAAVAAGLCAAAHGTDGGGSIRIPAAWCGVVGVKPTRGRVSAAPAASSLTATSGPLARTVTDAAALLDAMSGPTPGDAFAVPLPDRPFRLEASTAPSRLTVGVAVGRTPLDPDVAAGLDRVIGLLPRLGHRVSAREPEPHWDMMISPYLHPLLGATVRQALATLTVDAPLDPLLGAASREAPVSADDYAAATAELLTRARRAAEAFGDVDVLLTPTVAKTPPLIGAHRELPVAELFATWESYVPFTTMWNWTGQPAISLPVGFGADSRLPMAVQLVGRVADEATLFRLAGQLERELPATHR